MERVKDGKVFGSGTPCARTGGWGKRGHCNQKYLAEDKLAKQLQTILSNVALREDLATPMMQQVKQWEQEKSESSRTFAHRIGEQLHHTQQKLDKLVDGYLDGATDKEVYLKKKDGLMQAKIELEQCKTKSGRTRATSGSN